MTNRSLIDFARLYRALQADDLVAVRDALGGPLKGSAALALPLPLGGMSILHRAASRSQTDIMRCILDAVDWPADALDDALRQACMYRGRRSIKLLLERGASAHTPDEQNHTAFHCAAVYGRVEVLEFLADEAGEYTNTTLLPSPLTCALLHNQPKVVHSALRHQSDFDPFAAVLLQDRTRLARLLQWQPGIDQIALRSCGAVGSRLLHTAIRTGDPESVEFLLRMGIDPSSKTEGGLSASCLVAMSLACGSRPDFQCRWGHLCPTDTAGRTRILQLLTDAGAEQDLATSVALNDLAAVRRGLTPCSPTCADVGAALAVAMRMDNQRMVQAISDMAPGCGAAPFRPTLLAWSVICGTPAVTELLLSEGADPNDPKAFLLLLREDDLARVQLLLKAGADPDCRVGGNFLIHEACEYVSVDCITALVKAGASVCSVEDSGYGFAPLHVLTLGTPAYGRHSQPETAVNILRRAGADAQAKDRIFHAKPLEWAESGFHRGQPDQDLVQALKD